MGAARCDAGRWAHRGLACAGALALRRLRFVAVYVAWRFVCLLSVPQLCEGGSGAGRAAATLLRAGERSCGRKAAAIRVPSHSRAMSAGVSSRRIHWLHRQ